MSIKFYMVTGRDEAYEEVIRSVVNEVRSRVKGNERYINATFIRIRPEAANDILNVLNLPEDQVPQKLIYLVRSMKQDGVKALPALIINGKKIYEGTLPPPNEVKDTLTNEIMNMLQPQHLPPPPPQPQPQPITQPQTTTESTITEALAPPKPSPPPPTLPSPPPQQTTPPQYLPPQPTPQYPPTPSLPSLPLKIILGRPNNCNECAYYGPNTGTCLLFGFRVADPSRPPCKEPT